MTCDLTLTSIVTSSIFGFTHLLLFLYFTWTHFKILRLQLQKSARDVLNNRVPFRVLYVLNVYSHFAVLNAGLMVTKGIKLTNVLHLATADGHCINIPDWMDWYFHTFIDLSIMLSIIAVNSSTQRIVLMSDIAMMTCGLICEMTDRLAVQIPFFLIGGVFFVNIFGHIYAFYRTKNFFNREIEGLIRGMLGLVVFVWTLYPIAFVCMNMIWRHQYSQYWPLMISGLYLLSKFGFNFLFLAWDKRFQKTITTDMALVATTPSERQMSAGLDRQLTTAPPRMIVG